MSDYGSKAVLSTEWLKNAGIVRLPASVQVFRKDTGGVKQITFLDSTSGKIVQFDGRLTGEDAWADIHRQLVSDFGAPARENNRFIGLAVSSP